MSCRVWVPVLFLALLAATGRRAQEDEISDLGERVRHLQFKELGL